MSPQRLLSFIAFAHHLLLLLILHIDTASSPKTPPTSTAVASTTCSSLRSSTISDFVFALLPSCFTMHWPNVPFSTAAACLHSVAPRSQSLAAIARRSCSSLVLVLVCSCLTCTCAHSTLRSQCTCPESCAYHSALLHNIEHCFILYCIYCIVLLHRVLLHIALLRIVLTECK